MKKTIALTVAMLAVFSVIIMAFSSKVESDWQQPHSDSVDLTVSSPVDMVEKQYKIYDYQTGADCSDIYRHASEYRSMFSIGQKDGMLTTEQAASICGNTFETWYPQNSLAGPIYIQLVTYPHTENKAEYSAVYMEYIDYDAFTFEGDITKLGPPKREMNCEIDAYTGKITKLNSYAYDMDETELRDELDLTDELEQRLVDKSLEVLQQFGYLDFKNYIIYPNTMNVAYDLIFTDKQSTVVNIDFSKQNDVLVFESFALEPNKDNIQFAVEYLAANGKNISEECGL